MTPLTSSAGGGDPQRVGPYRLLRVVSEVGAHATCIAVRDVEGLRKDRVILRVISIPDATKRTLVAASWRWSMAIGNEHLMPLLDTGTDGSRVYGALPDGAAAPLAPLSSPPLPPHVVASIGVDVCTGLHAGHQHQGRKLVHHALSLDALFIDRSGRALVEGIFVAPNVAGETNSELPLWLASPEWVACGPFDARSDVYAMGALLWSLFTGKPLYENLATPGELLKLIRRGEVAPPSAFAPKVPPELDAIILDCLRRSPRDRPATTLELANLIQRAIDLRGARAHLSQLVRPGSASSRPSDAPSRVPRPAPQRVIDEESSESDATIVEMSPFFEVDDPTVVGRLGQQQPAAEPIIEEPTTDTDADDAQTKAAPRLYEDDSSDSNDDREQPLDESSDGEDEATTVMGKPEAARLLAEMKPTQSRPDKFGRVTTKMPSAAPPPADPLPPFPWPASSPAALPRIDVGLDEEDSDLPPPPLGSIPGALPAPMEPMRVMEAPRPANPMPSADKKKISNVWLVLLVIATFLLTAAVTALVLTRR